MAAFNLFERYKIDWVTFPEPNDSISFIETIKRERVEKRHVLFEDHLLPSTTQKIRRTFRQG